MKPTPCFFSSPMTGLNSGGEATAAVVVEVVEPSLAQGSIWISNSHPNRN